MGVLPWLQRDTHRTGVAAVHDSGFLLAIISVVFIPWYAWKTRGGWAGWRLALLLFLLMSAADIGQAVTAAFVGGDPPIIEDPVPEPRERSSFA